MKKRIFAFIFAVTLMATSVFPAMALDANSLPSDRATLSGLSTDEQLYFLQAQGIEVPHSYSEYITSLITHVEENPNHPIAINNPVCLLYTSTIAVPGIGVAIIFDRWVS